MFSCQVDGEDEAIVKELNDIVKLRKADLDEAGIRRVSFIFINGDMSEKSSDTRKTSSGSVGRKISLEVAMPDENSYPSIFTYRNKDGYSEDSIVRHIEPSLGYHLQLQRLSNFKLKMIPTPNRTIHMYQAVPHGAKPDARGNKV